MTDDRKLREGDQPLPTPNDEPDIQSQVIADIRARRELGIKRYGTALQPFNGRDAMRDLYEELLDGAAYAKQVMVEREKAWADDQSEWDRAMAHTLTLETGARLSCPRDDCGDNLLDQLDNPSTLGDIWEAIWHHDAHHAGLHADCQIVDLPHVGPMRVHGDLDEQGRTAMAEVVKAVQRQATDDLKAQGRTELLDTLLALRAQWDARRASRAGHRETTDGPEARLASIEHDFYTRILREFDQALEAHRG